MKRKVFSFLMVLMMTLSILPFGSIDADAFSTGAKTLIKTKTVTIKPGKTYKTPDEALPEPTGPLIAEELHAPQDPDYPSPPYA